MKKIKVLVIHQDGLLTGSGTSLRFLLKGLDPDQFDIRVILGGEGPLEKILCDDGFQVIVFPIRGFWTAPGPMWYKPGALKNLLNLFLNGDIIRVVRQIQPDIIHLNDKALISVGLRLRKLKIPIVQHLRSTYQATHTKPFVWISKWAIHRYATLLIGISEDESAEFKNNVKNIVIFNAMDTHQIKFQENHRQAIRLDLGIPAEVTMILFIGLFTRTKGAWDFMDMAGYFKRQYGTGTIKFVMVGPLPGKSQSGNYLNKILGGSTADRDARIFRAKVLQYDFRDEMIFPGYRSDVLDVIHAADVAVICNRLGAMGRQAFEVLSVGTPLLITAGHSGKSTVVIDKQSGIVVKAGDYAEMAVQLKKLIDDPKLRNQLSEAGRQHAETNFDFRKNGMLLGKAYQNLLIKQP